MASDEPQPETESEKRKRAGLLRLKAVCILPVLFGGAALAYFFMIDGIIADQLTMQARNVAGEGGNSEVGYVSFSIFGPKLTIRELHAWQDVEGRERREVIYLREANLDIEFWPLLEKRFVINDISASEIRYQQPWSPEPEPEPADVPTDTSQPELNDYLKQLKDILESEEIDDLRDWIEKLREYSKEEGATGSGEETVEEPAKAEPSQRTPDGELEPANRAWYVEKALSSVTAQPTVLVKHASLDELSITFGREDKNRFAHKVTQLELKAESISSDPVAYGQPMKFIAAGNLDGKESRRAEIGLTLRFSPDELISIEQVDGSAGLKSIDIGSLVDADVFGGTLLDAKLSVVHYASTHGEFSGRTQLRMSGSIQPPGFAKPAKASFGIWFGGFKTESAVGTFLPSGVSIQIEDFPLEPVLALAGGSPIPLANNQTTISFGTVDSNGRYGTPESALSWHDGIKVHLRMQVKGLSFADPGGDLAGLPGTFLVRGLNKVIDGMGGLDVVVGFEGSKDRIALDLEKPGLRAFVDAVVNALTLTAPEMKSLIDLPFELSSNATFGLASMNADGSVRDPKLSLDGEARHDLNDLRVGFNLRDVSIVPKPGQDTIIGLPAEDFCRAFNAFMASTGPDGLAIRTRIMNAEGNFSPALESPGTRGLVDAMASVLSYTGAQMNANFGLPMTVSPGAIIQCESVGEDGLLRTLSSPGANTDDFSNFRIRIRASNFTVSPKPGESTIVGLPATDFCEAFNGFIAAQGPKGLALDWGIFNGAGTFAPTLLSPGTRGLVDAMANTLKYTGNQLNARFDLPFTVAPSTQILLESVDENGNARTFESPGADGHDLSNLRLRLRAANFTVTPKAGNANILGIPAIQFCTSFNTFVQAQGAKGVALDLRILNNTGSFAPELKQPGTRGLVDGIANTLKYNGAQLNSTFDLPFKFADDASVEPRSIEPDGRTRTLTTPGSDSDSLAGMTVAVVLKNGMVEALPGTKTIMGVPAEYFTFAWNKLQASYGPNGMGMRVRLFNDKAEFAPALTYPDDKALLKQLGNVVGIDDFLKQYTDLPSRFKDEWPAFLKGGLKVARDIAEGKWKPPEQPKELPEDFPKIPKLPWGK
ncbi:MAG: hypothetical protein K8I27_15715 [Planctomycetes bacterium]|nr:hypothetical protein [Planctomycetota bacterium]